MDKLRITCRYWIFVIAMPAIGKAFPIGELRDKSVDILISLIAGMILTVVFGTIDPSLEVGINPVTILLVLAITFGFRLISSILYLPAKIYSDQGGFIENPFEIATVDGNFSQDETRWAMLKVSNTSTSAYIDDCFLELLRIVDLNINKQIVFEPQNLTWSGREQNNSQSGNQPITVYSGSPRWCDIALVSPSHHKAYYTTWFGLGLEQTSIKPGSYRLTTKAHGKWQNHPIGYLYSVDLSFYPQNNLHLENVQKIQTLTD